MAKLASLKFQGNFEQGFRVELTISREQELPYVQVFANLPPQPKLVTCLQLWQQQYYQLGKSYRIKPKGITYGGSISSLEKLRLSIQQLESQLRQWLTSQAFYEVDKRLREELNRTELVRLIICSDCPQVHQIPWCLWDLVERYPKLEIAVSNQGFERVNSSQIRKKTNKVRILALFGNSKGLDLEPDRRLLTALPNVELVFLVEPQRHELTNYLWEQAWDIIFFAGHSCTLQGKGLIHLNGEDSLTIEEIKFGLKQAIASGLQLAIFNSCDGLGLAYELGRLSLPQMIVMREPIPDRMAQEFLKYFLTAFAEGNSLYLATRIARERLHGWEHRFPCASWLPVIYQNPAVLPPTWLSLQGDYLPHSKPQLKPASVQFVPQLVGLTGLLVTMFWVLIRSWGWLQPLELQAFDLLLRLRPAEPPDERILVITIDENDIAYQRQQGFPLEGSLSDLALQQLITQLQPYQPRVIASDLIHDFPYYRDLAETIEQTDQFFAICRVGNQISQLTSLKPPSNLSSQQLGFSNLAIDPDDVIRRQILGMSPDRTCPADYSLSLRLALNYLGNPSVQLTQAGLQIGDLFIPQLTANSGGYNLPPQEAQGFQILVNYRSSQPPTVPLREILNGSLANQLEKLISNRIILIGAVQNNNDLHQTPYHSGTKLYQPSGVLLHAQMTSQITSAVLDRRPLLWWLPEWFEWFWIASWSLVGGAIVLIGHSWYARTVAIALAVVMLSVSCYFVLLIGGWLPLVPSTLVLLTSFAVISLKLS